MFILKFFSFCKDLMALKEQIDVIKNNINYTTNSMTELKNEVGTLKQHMENNIAEMDNKNNEFFKNFDENINLMENIKNKLRPNKKTIIVTGSGHLQFFEKHFPNAIFPFR